MNRCKKINSTWLLSIKGVFVKKQTESENVEMLFFNEKNNKQLSAKNTKKTFIVLSFAFLKAHAWNCARLLSYNWKIKIEIL